MWLEIKQLTRLQIIRYYEKLEKENKKLKVELDKIKKRVKEHTTYSVKAEFIKKFWE